MLQTMNSNQMCTYQPVCTTVAATTTTPWTLFSPFTTTTTTTPTSILMVYIQSCSIGGYSSTTSTYSSTTATNVPVAFSTTGVPGTITTATLAAGGSATITMTTGNVIVQQYAVRNNRNTFRSTIHILTF